MSLLLSLKEYFALIVCLKLPQINIFLLCRQSHFRNNSMVQPERCEHWVVDSAIKLWFLTAKSFE